MKKLLFLGVWVLFLASCGGKATQNPVVSADVLAEADLFNFEKVTAFSASLPEANRKDAKQSFLKAIDEYRNKKSAAKALPLFTQSLLKNPDAKTYYEYGNALLDTRDYPKAISAYHMAEKLDYSPLSKLMYNLACAYSLSKDGDNALKYMELAVQNGYANSDQILKDPDMEFARQTEGFNLVYTNAMSGAVSPERALFDLYLNEYPESGFPYQLTADKSQHLKFENAIGYDFEKFVPDMRDNQFSRDVGSEFYYVTRFPKAETYTLALYAEKSFWAESPPVTYYLCSYSPDGKLLDRIAVAGWPYFDAEIKAFKIKDNRNFEVSSYTTVWEKDVNEYGYEDGNRPAKRELTGTGQYRVNSGGKFVSAKPLLGLLGR